MDFVDDQPGGPQSEAAQSSILIDGLYRNLVEVQGLRSVLELRRYDVPQPFQRECHQLLVGVGGPNDIGGQREIRGTGASRQPPVFEIRSNEAFREVS